MYKTTIQCSRKVKYDSQVARDGPSNGICGSGLGVVGTPLKASISTLTSSLIEGVVDGKDGGRSAGMLYRELYE